MVEAYRSQYGADFINVMPTNLTAAATIIIPNTATSSPT
jgi:hypothetical protein